MSASDIQMRHTDQTFHLHQRRERGCCPMQLSPALVDSVHKIQESSKGVLFSIKRVANDLVYICYSTGEIEPGLKSWIQNAPTLDERKNRATAARRILWCYRYGLNTLSLASLSLTSLPSEIRCLDSIKKLDLSHNLLEKLPSAITNLRYLETLDLSYNLFASLPQEVCHFKYLKNLSLKSNLLTTLSSEINKLFFLEKLDLSHNKIIFLSSGLILSTFLKKLDLSYNLMRDISINLLSSIINLKYLALKNNHLKKLPSEVEQLIISRNITLDI